MSPELREVLNFCLEQAAQAPVSKRVSLYRGMAEICANERQSAELCQLADELEAAERKCRQFGARLTLEK